MMKSSTRLFSLVFSLLLFLPFLISTDYTSNIQVSGTIDIYVHCNPSSNYTCKLYNCDGTWTGKQCGPTNSNGKCGVFEVTEGCYYFVIDNGSQTCTGQQFNYSPGFPFTHHFYCTNCVACFQ